MPEKRNEEAIMDNERFKGEMRVRSYEEKLRFESAALESGYSVAITPITKDEYHLTFYKSKDTKADC